MALELVLDLRAETTAEAKMKLDAATLPRRACLARPFERLASANRAQSQSQLKTRHRQWGHGLNGVRY
ncbi:hypothetical protein PDIDSM_6695 [Penicillium digitatum]|nr:hypothetical protein PDIDSM_6695 [Penicillium digitatum]